MTAKKFVDKCFAFFESLGNSKIKHKPCKNLIWSMQDYRCANFKKKYVVAYIDNDDDVVICDFALQKMIK